MSASSPEGILGSIVLVAIFWVAYLIATRKSTRNLSTSTAIPPTLPGGSNGKWYEQYGGYMWSVLLVIVGGGAVLWGMYHPVRLADAVQWQEYWFPLLALWGFAAALVALNAKALAAAAAKTLQWVLAGVVFTLFIGLPVVDWIYGDDEPVKPTRVLTRVPQDDLPQVRDVGGNVTDPATWPKLYLSIAEPKSALLPMAPGKRIVMAAVKGTKFKSHTVYRDGHECVSTKGSACPDGGVVGAYATNEGDVDIIVSYAYDSLKNKPL